MYTSQRQLMSSVSFINSSSAIFNPLYGPYLTPLPIVLLAYTPDSVMVTSGAMAIGEVYCCTRLITDWASALRDYYNNGLIFWLNVSLGLVLNMRFTFGFQFHLLINNISQSFRNIHHRSSFQQSRSCCCCYNLSSPQFSHSHKIVLVWI